MKTEYPPPITAAHTSSKSEKGLLLFLYFFSKRGSQNGIFAVTPMKRVTKPLPGVVGSEKKKRLLSRLAYPAAVRGRRQRKNTAAALAESFCPALRGMTGSPDRESRHFFRARFYRSTKYRCSLILSLRESCWGVPSPNPAYAVYPCRCHAANERRL